jgi:hypothetical protein
MSGVKMVKPLTVGSIIKLKNASDVVVEKLTYYSDEWGKAPAFLPVVSQTQNWTGVIPGNGIK